MTKHLSSYASGQALYGVTRRDMDTTGDSMAASVEECDCLACFRSVMRSDTGFFEEYVNRIFEQEWRPRFVKLVRGVPGMRGDETFTQVLDIVADRLIPTNPVVPVNPANPDGEPMLLVLVTRDDWSTELLPAQTPCYLLEKT